MSLHNIINSLTALGFHLVSSITQGNNDSWFLILRQAKLLLTKVSVKVAYPTGSQTLLRCSQTKVFHSDSNINVSMMFDIGSYLLFIM